MFINEYSHLPRVSLPWPLAMDLYQYLVQHSGDIDADINDYGHLHDLALFFMILTDSEPQPKQEPKP